MKPIWWPAKLRAERKTRPRSLSTKRKHSASFTSTDADSSLSERRKSDLPGILVRRQDCGQKARKDSCGTLIDHVRKAHHISFRDTATGGKLADVKEIASYKLYNKIRNEENMGCCCCTVF